MEVPIQVVAAEVAEVAEVIPVAEAVEAEVPPVDKEKSAEMRFSFV